MNLFSIREYVSQVTNPRASHRHSSFLWTMAAGLVLFLSLARPDVAAAANHGASIQKTILNVTRVGATNVVLGDTLQISIIVRNFDSFGDTIRITNIYDVIQYRTGPITNIFLPTPTCDVTNLL